MAAPYIPCLALPSQALPSQALPCQALPCHALPCRALPCRALPCLGWQIVYSGNLPRPEPLCKEKRTENQKKISAGGQTCRSVMASIWHTFTGHTRPQAPTNASGGLKSRDITWGVRIVDPKVAGSSPVALANQIAEPPGIPDSGGLLIHVCGLAISPTPSWAWKHAEITYSRVTFARGLSLMV